MVVGSGAPASLCFSSATKIKQRWLSGGRQKEQPGFAVPEELCLFATGSQGTPFLSFAAWGIFCPHRAFQLQLFSGGHRLPDGAGTLKCNCSEMMSFSWAAEKSFVAKLGLNDSKCQGGMPGVKGMEDLISQLTSGVQTFLQV